jgi:hypothetical protein
MNCGQLYRITFAAEELGLRRSTLATAIARGEIRVYQTACGLPLVTLADVREWTTHERKVGRPKNT